MPPWPVNENLENLRVNSAGEKNSGGERHGDEQFDLVMQPAFVVEEADGGDERGAGDDAERFERARAVEREQNREHDAALHREAAEERNRLQVDFARSGQIDHADAQSERANRDGEHQRCEKSDNEGQQSCGHESSMICDRAGRGETANSRRLT